MTKYDLRQWKKHSEPVAAERIADAKFAIWRTRILFAAANADAEDSSLALKQLLSEMIVDTCHLGVSGIKGPLRDCAELYDQVWAHMCDMFRSVARTDILDRDGFMNAFGTIAEELMRLLLADSGKESTE
nr:MAG TPA: hypothetical protein [Caudoviricetes sp.]